MDLSTAITTAGADLVTNVTAALTSVAPISLAVIAIFAGFALALKAFRRGSKG